MVPISIGIPAIQRDQEVPLEEQTMELLGQAPGLGTAVVVVFVVVAGEVGVGAHHPAPLP
jgi:hypothetical protein